jgi:hypothetical protein
MLEPVDMPSLNDELAVQSAVARREGRCARGRGFAFVAAAGSWIRAFKHVECHESKSPIRISKSCHYRFDKSHHEWNQQDNG